MFDLKIQLGKVQNETRNAIQDESEHLKSLESQRDKYIDMVEEETEELSRVAKTEQSILQVD